MKRTLFLSAIVMLSASIFMTDRDASAFGKKPIEQVEVQPAKTPIVTVTPSEPVNADKGLAAIELIKQAASGSECASYRWEDRGRSPKSYVQGVALVYARSVCKPDPVVASELKGSSDKDAMTYLGIKPSNKNTYALMMGLGMRESSGGLDCGRDATADNVKGEDAEAGLFQTSWDVGGSKEPLQAIWQAYQKGERKCLKDEFFKNVTCKPAQMKNWGTGIGLEYQKFVKSCPAFATEFAANSVRRVRRHYGPINTKKVEFKNICVDLLTKVEDIVKANPDVCSAL